MMFMRAAPRRQRRSFTFTPLEQQRHYYSHAATPILSIAFHTRLIEEPPAADYITPRFVPPIAIRFSAAMASPPPLIRHASRRF